MPRVDVQGVTRHASILEVPDDFLECLVFGHGWDPGPLTTEQDGYGRNSDVCEATCSCTRRRREVYDPRTGALLGQRQYYGGHGFEPGAEVNRDEARAERGRRIRARAARATPA